jgi:hypothetical protein
MKKILIIACGLMFSSLSAMTLPDHVSVVKYEKNTMQELAWQYADQVLCVENYDVSDFDFVIKNIMQPQTFSYVHDINVVDRKGFVKPVLYESFREFQPLANYEIYKVKVPDLNEILFSNRIRDASTTLVV